jgi:hypothetical protein
MIDIANGFGQSALPPKVNHYFQSADTKEEIEEAWMYGIKG